VAAVCVAVVALIAGASVALWQASLAQREAARANQEAETSTATLDALVTMLTEVNPEERQGVTFTARDLVDAGLGGLQELEDQPRVHATMMNALGRVSRGVGFLDLADSLHRRALEVQRTTLGDRHPEVAESLVRIGQVHQEQGREDEAEAAYRRALAVTPDQVSALLDLGVLLFYQGRFEAAVGHLETALEVEPRNTRLLNTLGAIYYYMGRLEDAQRVFGRSVAAAPTYEAYSNLATLRYYTDQDYAGAARLYEQALELNDGDYAVWGHLGSSYYWSGQQATAETTFQRAIRMAEAYLADANPDDAIVHADLASYHAVLGREQEAQSYASRALELGPQEAIVLYTVAHAYEQIGQRARALDVLRRAIEAGHPLSDIQQEPGFRALREDPRFQQVKAQVES